MSEFFYGINSAAIALALFLSMAIAIEAGYRIGRKRQRSVDEAFKTHVNSIAAALLGLLALLLGFTLSLSLTRFDTRSAAVVAEANAIGTTWLRAQLLPAPVRGEVQKLLRVYADQRIAASGTNLAEREAREMLTAKANHTQAALWSLALQAAELAPNPVSTGLFVQSLNEMIDAMGSREAALDRHVPELVLLLLYATFLMTGAIVGYSAGVAGHRASFVTYVMVALIVVLVFVILDLDRPRRGLIQVSQKSLVELGRTMTAEPGVAVPAAGRPGR
jgi:FtsH-binding integral membrane protein